MKLTGIVICAAVLLCLPLAASAQSDPHGEVDTVYADVSRVDDQNWTITVSYTNDEAIVGLTVPLKMSAGLNRIVADSAIYTGGRVDHFTLKAFRPDTAIQCVLLGMVANLGPTYKRLEPGSGRLATIFVSSLEDKPIDSLVVDTATVPPGEQRLLGVADEVQGTPPDTTRIPRDDVRITPAFVIRYAQ
ncbi:hypothetical protein GF420_09780 [candidate division GN15 bacterium]|nr:hypothetical protein [candidate division GN15 bacterium]